jgi:hypothetical protein
VIHSAFFFSAGRAKKRILYNRRFATAVTTFGKRKMNPAPTHDKP